MVSLTDYDHFKGRQWDTGPLTNALAAQGFIAPHTGQAFSEALLFGLSGGIIAGYFVFEYQGLDPMLHFLTRNTIDPWDNMLARLGLQVEYLRTADAEKGHANLLEVLESGKPAIVWVDVFGLPYAVPGEVASPQLMAPVLVYAVEGGKVFLADRAAVQLVVDSQHFTQARAKLKNNRNQIMTIEALNPDKLSSSVQESLETCIKYHLDEPPLKPMKGKFGLAAYTRWAEMLADKTKKGWAQQFAPGRRMYAGLTSAFYTIQLYGTRGLGARPLYAEFLEEAALILDRPSLKEVSRQFHKRGVLWDALNKALLPDSVPLFQEARALMVKQEELFVELGMESLEERQEISQRLDELKEIADQEFPLSEGQAAAMREDLAEKIMAIHDAEKQAFGDLREALRN